MKISRRKFFGQAACAAMGTTTLFNTLVNLSITNSLVGHSLSATSTPAMVGDDYKALVCILLAGGNDSFNMLIPNETDAYNTYADTRTNLAIAQNSLLPIDANGVSYGLHPNMPEIQNLYDTGKLSFIANIGTLAEPLLDNTEYYDGEKAKPLGLYSHSDQTQQWQTSLPLDRTTIGWGGRTADILKSFNSQQSVSMNISLDGRNIWQAGDSVIEYAIDNDTGSSLYGQYIWDSNAGFMNEVRNAAVENLMAQQYSNVFQQTFGSLSDQALVSHEAFSTAMALGQAVNTSFSDTKLSQDLRMVARTIAARNALNVSRQTFFVTIGGFDNHDELLDNHAALLQEVSRAMSEFYTALEELNVADCVTTFTISDFARTLTTNGNGSDHSWGGNQMVMGGAVNGGQIFGTYPDLTTGSSLAIDERGTLIPTLSTDEYFAELAMWFGISRTNGDLYSVLPNIGNFYSPSGINPIGFLPV